MRRLHAFRIEGKQLRYAMEIFAGAFPPAFRGELYPLVEQLQERLGKINDHATAWVLFVGWLTDDNTGPDGPIVADLVAAEKIAMAEGRQDSSIGGPRSAPPTCADGSASCWEIRAASRRRERQAELSLRRCGPLDPRSLKPWQGPGS